MRAAIWSRSRVVMPGLGLFFERANRGGDDLASLAHDRDLARRLQHDGVVGGRLQVHAAAVVCIAERARVAFLLGLTGNIACGKSTVGQLLAERFGAEYVDADRIVHALYAAGTPETRRSPRASAATCCSPTAPSIAAAWATSCWPTGRAARPRSASWTQACAARSRRAS